MGYQTIGRFAMGMRALGFSSGLVVKVGNDDPGPHRIRA
jgi:sugar/nucleoside kinase (ribokinase family)